MILLNSIPKIPHGILLNSYRKLCPEAVFCFACYWRSSTVTILDGYVIKENSYQVAESFIDKICPPTIIFVVLSGNVLAMKVFLRDFRLLPSLGYLMITFLFDLYFIVTESINDWYIALYG